MERIGLIDLGSNTARLAIYDLFDNGTFVNVDEMKESVRLAETERDGNLKSTRILQAINTVRLFKKYCAVNKTDRIIAIATAAVRQAKNQRSFLNDMQTATGIRFDVLSEDAEATLAYQGVVNTMEISKGIILEIGGGSTKIVYFNRRSILRKHVFDFGGLVLARMFASPDIKPEEMCEKIENYVLQRFEEAPWLTAEVDPDTTFIGVGGSIRSLARVARKACKYPLEMVHNYQLTRTDFETVYNTIRPFDLEKASRIKSVTRARADTFPCALAVVKAFFDHTKFETITTCTSSIREGIMFNTALPQTLDKPISDVLGNSLQSHINHLRLNPTTAEQVFNLTVQLFKQLRVLHKFARGYVRVLRIAALLFESGRTFKFYDFPKHSAYIILNSNLYGVSHHDLVLAAFICATISKDGTATPDWMHYKTLLTDEDVEAAKKLAVMLRLAYAFETSRNSVISEINCDVLGDSVILKVETDGDASLEIKEAQTIAIEFKKMFKKNLEIL